METVDGRISDKYLEHKEVSDFEEGRSLIFFKNISKEKKKLRDEIDMLNQITMTEEHEEALIPHETGVTSHLNRYCDILPYKHSAVSLDHKLKDEKDYINANYIPGPFGEDKLFVACQGPKSNTVKDFWRMVRQENILHIIMLCRLTEGGRTKCEKYWPGADESLKFEDIHLEVKSKGEKAITDNLVERDFSLIDLSSNETISEVKQVQYTGWPDHGIPEKDQFDDFDKLVQNTMEVYNTIKAEDSQKKMLLHCSAGIGRTGTLLSIVHMLAQLNEKEKAEVKPEKVSVFSVVRKLREHRFHLVQTDVQYYFIFEYLATHLKKLKLI